MDARQYQPTLCLCSKSSAAARSGCCVTRMPLPLGVPASLICRPRCKPLLFPGPSPFSFSLHKIKPTLGLSASESDLSSSSVTTAPLYDNFGGQILSREWPGSFSVLNFEDLCKHYEPLIFKEEAQPSTPLADIMSKTIYTAKPDQHLEEINHFFLTISGLPVINDDLKCIGVLSKKDREKASKGLKSMVGEVMTSPPICLSADKTLNDAAILMLKNKIHRIPIVNEANQVVGIITRSDIFKALEGEA